MRLNAWFVTSATYLLVTRAEEKIDNDVGQPLHTLQEDWTDLAHHAITGQYIIVFDETIVSNATAKSLDLIRKYGETGDSNFDGYGATEILWNYETAFKGVTMRNVGEKMLVALRDDADVKYFEHDAIVSLDRFTSKYEQDYPPNWGLDRIDERLVGEGANEEVPGFDGEYNFDFTGNGVLVFVVDTGIRFDHEDFLDDDARSRINCGYDSYDLDYRDKSIESGCYDGVGHGTHMAGIIGGNVYGVAKDVIVVSVKSFTVNGFGSIGSVMSGLEFVQRNKLLYPDVPMVANLSFGTKAVVKSFEEAIDSLINTNVVVVASAGNDSGDACLKMPASIKRVITVGATTYKDEVANYSNMGRCVDIFAPGDRITSTWRDRDFDRATISGTSTAAAHVSGVAALVLEKYPLMEPDELHTNLQLHSEVNAVRGILDPEDTPNLLLNMASIKY